MNVVTKTYSKINAEGRWSQSIQYQKVTDRRHALEVIGNAKRSLQAHGWTALTDTPEYVCMQGTAEIRQDLYIA